MANDDFHVGQKVPNKTEVEAVGEPTTRIKRGTEAFKALVKYTDKDVIFKDEEHTGADLMMTSRMRDVVKTLAGLVAKEWPGKKLRITEAWDENIEHTEHSTHYEGRGADMTVSDVDGSKLGRLARLAVQAGFEWVFFENKLHVHASMKK